MNNKRRETILAAVSDADTLSMADLVFEQLAIKEGLEVKHITKKDLDKLGRLIEVIPGRGKNQARVNLTNKGQDYIIKLGI